MFVLEEPYAQAKSSPMSPDLDTLWKKLGVAMKNDDPILENFASVAAIRQAIRGAGAAVLKGRAPEARQVARKRAFPNGIRGPFVKRFFPDCWIRRITPT